MKKLFVAEGGKDVGRILWKKRMATSFDWNFSDILQVRACFSKLFTVDQKLFLEQNNDNNFITKKGRRRNQTIFLRYYSF